MARFVNDVDILKCEPILFGELHLPAQVRASGTGAVLNGAVLTAGEADLIAAGVEAGGVIYLRSSDGALDGAYEIVSVDSATQLTVSVVRADPSDPAVAPPAGSEISYRISTLAPQATEAAFELTQHFGIQPGAPTSEITVENIINTEGLRRASALNVIARVYRMWANHTQDECLHRKSRRYEELYEKARQRCHVSADLGSDGVADVNRVGGVVRLVRD